MTIQFRASLPRLAVIAALVISIATSVEPQSKPASGDAARLLFTYLGAAGWRVTDGRTVILIDPYLSRLFGPQPPGRAPFPRASGDMRKQYGWSDQAEPDLAEIDSRIKRADYVLVTHTHYDHILDVPHIALTRHATVIGTESTQNVMRAYQVPEDQLITVRGGEDYEFASFSLRVIPSLHSPLDHKRYFSGATAPAGMKAPLTLEQMHPEGGTIAFLIRFRGRQVLAFGGMNYIEREIAGLTPDVVLVGAGGSRKEIFDYTGRLLRALNLPALVLPTHWDNFTAPYTASQQPSLDDLGSFVKEVAAVSPKSKVVIPKYFEPIEF